MRGRLPLMHSLLTLHAQTCTTNDCIIMFTNNAIFACASVSMFARPIAIVALMTTSVRRLSAIPRSYISRGLIPIVSTQHSGQRPA